MGIKQMSDADTVDDVTRDPVDGGAPRGRWPAKDGAPAGRPRYTRRLSDKILFAFHHACDQQDLEIARHLLGVLEFMSTRPAAFPAEKNRRSNDSLVAAHERLWILRHPHDTEC